MADAAQDTGTANTDAGGTPSTTEPTGTENTNTQGTTNEGGQPNTEGTKPEGEVVYEFKAPDGVELDKAQVDQFTAIAKDLKLPADKAQALVDIAAKAEVARREAFAKEVESWGAQIAADKDLGNAENQAAMRGLVDKFGSDDLKGLLNSTGLGSHPALVRFVHNVTKAMSEDSIKGKAAGESVARDPASVLYGNTTTKA